MSFVGYDYIEQHGIPPEANGVVPTGMFDGL